MEKRRNLRAAVVGCGALARSVHLPNLKENPRVELAVTCDIDFEKARECCELYGAERAESDWRRLIDDPDIDLIILVTHTELRGELIVPALRAGKPVYTEKPLTTDREELLEIVRTSTQEGVPVCVGHNRRSSPAMIEFKRLLDRAKTYKNPVRPSVDRHYSRAKLPEEERLQLLIRIDDDARSWKEWGFWSPEGTMFNEMVHFIDIALWLNDSYPVRLFAEGSPRGNFVLVMRFADGSLTTFHHSMVGHFDYPKELFEATVNNISLAMDHHIEIRQFGMEDEEIVKVFPFNRDCDWAEKEGMSGYMQAMENELQRIKKEGGNLRFLRVNKGHYMHLDRFMDHIEGNGENPCDAQSAAPVNRIAVRALQSARLGMPVQIGCEDWHIPQISDD